MKKVILLIVLFAFIAKAYSQTTEKPVLTKEDYLKKAKDNKSGAWVTLGLGGGMLVCAAALASGLNKANDNAVIVLGIAGATTSLLSIPLFHSAHKYKKRAASIALRNLNINYPAQNNFVVKRQPAITLKIPL